MDFSKLFHQSSKDLTNGGTVHVPKDESVWPKQWRQTEYKSYGALPRVSLPTFETNTVSSAIEKRKSTRAYAPVPIDLGTLSQLLRFSCGEIGGLVNGSQIRRAQPSGGGRFPLETYLLIFRSSAELAAGVYHYAVSEHRLETLWPHEFTKKEVDTLYSYPWVADAAGVVVITAVFNRTQRKYGERGYRYVLLEAGHVGQNIYLLSNLLGIGCCAVEGSNDEKIEQTLRIDGVTESVLYSVVIGVPKNSN